jgi:LmbE family N-acetylglucosaminyl deacetylase
VWQSLERMLVVCAHADDEVLGAAGTISRAVRRGIDVHVVVLSTSVRSRQLSPSESEGIRTKRHRDAIDAAGVLGVSVEIHDFPDNAFETVPATTINAVVERAVADRRPDVVLTHWAHDLSTDHQVTARAVMVACRPANGRATPSVLAFEIRSSTDWAVGAADQTFSPSVFVGVDDEAWSTKQAALGCYADELRDPPHARSLEGIDALARYRGTQVGLARAEAFVLLRSVLAD